MKKLALLLSSLVIQMSSFAAEPRPNIIYIMADELGYYGRGIGLITSKPLQSGAASR